MKKYFTIIVTCICILSLVLNVVVINKYYKEKNAYDPVSDWNDYSVLLRMYKQGYVFDAYSEYLQEIIDKESSWDKLSAYAQAVKDFSYPELVQGDIDVKVGDNELVKSLFSRMFWAGWVMAFENDEVATFAEEELLEMQQIYADLEYLLNVNHQEKSFTYYVQHDDFTSDESLKVQDQVIKKLKVLERLFGESVFD